MEIGTRAAIFGIPGRRDPVTGLAPRIHHFHRCRGSGAMAQAGQLDTADAVQRQIGNVHVQYRTRWQIQVSMGFNQFAREMGSCGKVLYLA
ncbi:hypothetical protein D9M73_133490 [compost metagenome]